MKSEKFRQGQKVYSEVYGTGVVIWKGYGRKGSENYGIVFEKGGPQGWADKANFDIADLVAVQ
jgi:hypothetical protein